MRALEWPRQTSLCPLEVAIAGVCNFNPTCRTCWNHLDGDGLCFDGAFVTNDMHMISAIIDKPHPCCVHMRLTSGVMPFIVRHCPGCDDDQTIPRMRVPASASARRPDIFHYVDV